MRVKKALILVTFGTVVIAAVGLGYVKYEIWRFERQLFRQADLRATTCAQAIDGCRNTVLVGKAEAASANELYLSDLRGASGASREGDRIVPLWGAQPNHNAQHAIYGRAVVNDFLTEFGPWVVCWERDDREYTCYGLGANAPDNLSYYDPSIDVALNSIAAGYAHFQPKRGTLPLPVEALDPDQPMFSLSGLYLRAQRSQGVQR